MSKKLTSDDPAQHLRAWLAYRRAICFCREDILLESSGNADGRDYVIEELQVRIIVPFYSSVQHFEKKKAFEVLVVTKVNFPVRFCDLRGRCEQLLLPLSLKVIGVANDRWRGSKAVGSIEMVGQMTSTMDE